MTTPATMYEEWFVPAVFAPLARETLAMTDLAPDARILDVACGSGIVARLAARRIGPSGSVAGLDLNPAMLAMARAAAEAEGLAIDWREGSADDLPFADGAFDTVFCQMGLQFFPDRPRAVSEMRRVLAPGGQAAASTWRDLSFHPLFAAWSETVERVSGSTAMGLPFSFGDPPQLQALFADAGFGDVRAEPVTIEADLGEPERYVERQIVASGAAISALREMRDEERTAAIDALSEVLAPVIAEHVDNGRVRVTMTGTIVRAFTR